MEKILKNMMETIVEQRMEDMLPSLDCCKCQQCQMDMRAIVLNKMPAKYVVSTKGELISRIDSLYRQNATDLTAAIVQAAEIVSKNPNPHHDPDFNK